LCIIYTIIVAIASIWSLFLHCITIIWIIYCLLNVIFIYKWWFSWSKLNLSFKRWCVIGCSNLTRSYSILKSLLKFLVDFSLYKWILWFILIYEYLQISFTIDHSNCLAYFITPLIDFFTHLFYVSTKFFKIKLDEVDLSIISILNSVKNRFVWCFKHINSHIDLLKLSFIFISGHFHFILL